MSALTMSPDDELLLVTLTRCCRILTMRQIGVLFRGEGVSPDYLREVSRRVRKLVEKGFLDVVKVLARPPLPLRIPVITWSPGDHSPSFTRAAHRLQSRWTEPVLRLSCVLASERAINLLGGSMKALRHPLQATHDLGVSQLYLRFRTVAPDLARSWVGEDGLDRTGRFRTRSPDAALCAPDGHVFLALEFGGAYPPARLQSFHEACVVWKTPYQVW